MARRKLLLTVLVAAVLLPLMIPQRVLVAPEWKLILKDELGRPMAQIKVQETWQHYSLEDREQDETRMTDGNGSVVFPARAVHSNAIRRFVGCIRQFGRFGVHASCGPYAWLVVFYPSGYGQNNLQEFVQGELNWAGGGASHLANVVIVHKCKNGGTGSVCMQR